ncbi:MlaD family protein [Mycobacterium vicinigordonae]|uniref:MCE family protein n=1 Tax=Mycobacterium vicinigordonae TaxID=1719132 RepID=A0A7D6DZV1_9MYCO|nr:MlaD family protein [Mycobacterium vicinigordonae]QLL08707.1 MCE family protein [Mycobacterium vicinigordonae]
MTARLKTFAAVVVVLVLALTSCASLNASSLPQPGNSFGDGFDVVLKFDNVLNLPDRAKVMLDGITVGVVTAMKLKGDGVDVTARIGKDVTVPSNIRASLEQATVLGDIYVALQRPSAGPVGPPLRAGSRVPLTQTSSPPQLEDTIAGLANFVSSGSIQRIQKTVIRLNRLTPPTEEVRRLTSLVVTDLTDVSSNIDQVDQLLGNVTHTAEIVNSRVPWMQFWFSPKGQTGFDRSTKQLNVVGVLFPGLGSIYSGGYWLVPLLNSLANTLGSVREAKLDFEAEVPAWRRLFTNFFLPEDKYPAINITSIVGPDGREMSGNVQDVLRMLGAVP